MGSFSYTHYDSFSVLERIHQPVLALYGSQDRAIPLVESARDLVESLEAGGNRHYTIRYLEGADHGLQLEDGELAPDSIAVTAGWIHHLPEVPTVRQAGATPEQSLSATAPPPSPAYASGKVLLTVFALQAAGYLAGPLTARLTGAAHRGRLAHPAAAGAWRPIKRSLFRLAGAGTSSAVLITLMMGVEADLPQPRATRRRLSMPGGR